MTAERYIIAALSIACAVLAWIAFAPAPSPEPIDPESIRSDERVRMLEVERAALYEALEAAKNNVDTVTIIRYRYTAKHDSIVRVRVTQSDSVQGVVLKQRLQ